MQVFFNGIDFARYLGTDETTEGGSEMEADWVKEEDTVIRAFE